MNRVPTGGLGAVDAQAATTDAAPQATTQTASKDSSTQQTADVQTVAEGEKDCADDTTTFASSLPLESDAKQYPGWTPLYTLPRTEETTDDDETQIDQE